MKEDVTTPPCEACLMHDELEKTLRSLDEANTTQHGAIVDSLNIVSNDVRWMNVIGKWLLATMLGYFIGIGYYILTADIVTKDQLKEVKENVDNGEKLHYRNENNIAEISGKMDLILEHIKRTNK